MQVLGIYIYPIKSLGAISLTQCEVTLRGLTYDRCYMLIDEHGEMLTQRQLPQLTLFKLALHSQGFLVTYYDKTLVVPFSIDGPTKLVRIWDDEVTVRIAPEQYSQWFSERLHQKVSLVYMPNDSLRAVNPNYAKYNDQVNLVDGYPVLMLSDASLHYLNALLEEPVGCDRFRPNVYLSAQQPHAEDELRKVQIGSVFFYKAKRCARCVIVNINPETAVVSKQPLATLATYRADDQKVNFGVNMMVQQTGMIKVGDVLIECN